jgi:hypothetical protein
MPKSPRSNRHNGTSVRFPDGQTIVFQEQLSRAVAIKRALKARKSVQNPVDDPVAHAMERFEEFNNKPPTELVRMKLDLNKTPLINIGKVPEIHYTSRKEGGKPVHYVHFLKKQGTMYAHPDGGLFLTLAPSTTVTDWLREENPRLQAPRVTQTERGTEVVFPEEGNKTIRFTKRLDDAEAIAKAKEILDNPEDNKHLVAANIEKARARYEALSDEAKSKIRNQKSYIMRIAWQIQRGRLKEYGHK